MYTLLIVLFVLVCILMSFVILIQSSKGGGLAGTFGGSGDQMGQVFGGRGAGDFLTKFTAILATVFMVVALLLGMMTRGEVSESSLIQQEREKRMEAPTRILPQVPEQPSESQPPNPAPSGTPSGQ